MPMLLRIAEATTRDNGEKTANQGLVTPSTGG